MIVTTLKIKNENSISPNDLFTIHEKGFKYKFIKEETQSGKVVQLIDLYPEKADKKNYSIVKVTIDKLKTNYQGCIYQQGWKLNCLYS